MCLQGHYLFNMRDFFRTWSVRALLSAVLSPISSPAIIQICASARNGRDMSNFATHRYSIRANAASE